MRSTAYVAGLELDLEVFTGPFDLLLTLILKDEIDLLEVDLADVVLTYLDHLEAQGQIDLEVATEFLILITALLELKSRLLLPREDSDELEDLLPEEAAEELLERMLQARKFKLAAEYLSEKFSQESNTRYRSAPLPNHLLQFQEEEAVAVYDPDRLGRAVGTMLRMPPQVNLNHVTIARVSLPERLKHLRSLLNRGRFTFSEAVAGTDRTTVAVTLWALLELYRQGEADWEQDEPFAEIEITRLDGRPQWELEVAA